LNDGRFFSHMKNARRTKHPYEIPNRRHLSDSLAKLTAFDLQLNPASPDMQFHKLDKAQDKRFWYVRVSAHLRLIVHRSDDSLLLCYVDHHDKAYRWAERRKLEIHSQMCAAQLVKIRESVKEIVIPAYMKADETEKPITPLFAQTATADLHLVTGLLGGLPEL